METGLRFDFSYGADTSWEQMVAFETAGMMWSDYIADDMTVNIHVEMTDTLPDNVIGGALPGMVADINYTHFRNAYQADITSWDDRQSFNSLSLMREGYGGFGPGGTWEKFEAIIDMGSKVVLQDSSDLNMTRANAKALGLVHKNDRALDGYIKMNNLSDASLEWDYNPYWTPSGSLDFLSTAVHEIGHVLGFISGVDKYQGVDFNNINDFYSHFGSDNNAGQFVDNVLNYANPLDLFRHSDKSLNYDSSHHTSNDKVIDMSIGSQAYFGPGKKYFAYATGKDTSIDGDGFQASHWKQNSNEEWVQGIMDPLMKPGVMRRISNRDLMAIDAIGYDISRKGTSLKSSTNASLNWKPVTGQGTDIGTLQWRAKDHIAKTLYGDRGQADWVDTWIKDYAEYSSYMTKNRDWEVNNMIDRSELYEHRGSYRSRTSTRTYRQEVFWQEAYFSSVSSEYFNASATFIDPAFIFTSIEQADVANETNDPNPFENNSQEALEVASVATNLLSLEAKLESINTVSTELETELLQNSLYNEQLGELDLSLSFA